MGSACCVAAKDITLPSISGGETLHRNVGYSPSWSFRRDARRRVAGEIENAMSRPSHEISEDNSMEIKGEFGSDRGNISGRGSPLENFETPTSQSSPVHEGHGGNLVTPSDHQLMAGNGDTKSPMESPELMNTSAPKVSFSVPSSSPSSTPTADPLSSHTRSLPANPTQSRQVRRSPGYKLLRHVSDNWVLGSKSPNKVSEGRPSFVLSTGSNDLAARSQGGSSDGWSMRTFSELVASSQRERWSFDSEYLDSGRGKISESSGRFSYSPSTDLQTCGACSKVLTDRSSWISEKIISSNEPSIVSVLVCGHVYHAECLEIMTPEADRYDPSCPLCTIGKKQLSKLSRKALRAEAEVKPRNNRISRNRVVDSYLDSGFDALDHQKNTEREGKAPKMEPSSTARCSSSKSALRRPFFLGSKWNRSTSENDSSRKKGFFWARYRKD